MQRGQRHEQQCGEECEPGGAVTSHLERALELLPRAALIKPVEVVEVEPPIKAFDQRIPMSQHGLNPAIFGAGYFRPARRRARVKRNPAKPPRWFAPTCRMDNGDTRCRSNSPVAGDTAR